MTDAARIDLELAVRAFENGFKVGADPLRSSLGTLVERTHVHWRRGYEAGRKAAELAVAAYRDELRGRP